MGCDRTDLREQLQDALQDALQGAYAEELMDMLELLRKLVQQSPLSTDEMTCVHCGANIWHSKGDGHLPDCPWVEAKLLLESLES